MSAYTLTPSLITAAAMDAGNRSMRAAGRQRWAIEDWDTATREHERLLTILTAQRKQERETQS